jgi:hypothetical protein
LSGADPSGSNRLAGQDKASQLTKNYAVGLEISCPGGAYHWAPEIPQHDDDSRRHAKKNMIWVTIGLILSLMARAQVRAPFLQAVARRAVQPDRRSPMTLATIAGSLAR